MFQLVYTPRRECRTATTENICRGESMVSTTFYSVWFNARLCMLNFGSRAIMRRKNVDFGRGTCLAASQTVRPASLFL